MSGKPEIEQEIDSPKAFWDTAEEIIAQQYPELAGKTDWPDTKIHVSMYAKIKYFYKLVSMQTPVRELLSKYESISRFRNALFHGTSEQRLPVDDVRHALESFEWIENNCVLADK